MSRLNHAPILGTGSTQQFAKLALVQIISPETNQRSPAGQAHQVYSHVGCAPRNLRLCDCIESELAL